MKETKIAPKVEFEPLVIGAPDKLFVAAFGRPGTGKTRLMATAPGLGVIPLQRKTRPTVEQVLKELYPKRKVWWPKDHDAFYRYKNPMEMSLMNRDESIAFFRALVDRIKAGCWALLDNKDVQTIGIDSGYELYQLIVAAHYGRSLRFSAEKTAWEPPNTEMRMLLASLQTKHVVFTTEAKDAYEGKNPLGWDEPAGYKPIGYEANVLVENRFERNGTAEPIFSIDVRMCQDRAALMGQRAVLLNDMCEFKYLASTIRPDTQPEDWE